MTVLTPKTKAQLMRKAFAKLASDYTVEGRTRDAGEVISALAGLSDNGKADESIVRLYDILTATP